MNLLSLDALARKEKSHLKLRFPSKAMSRPMRRVLDTLQVNGQSKSISGRLSCREIGTKKQVSLVGSPSSAKRLELHFCWLNLKKRLRKGATFNDLRRARNERREGIGAVRPVAEIRRKSLPRKLRGCCFTRHKYRHEVV